MFFRKSTLALMVTLIGVLLLAGCGNNKKENAGENTAGEKEPVQNTEQAEKTALQIYFTRDNQGTIEAAPVTREVSIDGEDTAAAAEKALELLYEGPTGQEKKQGLVNNLPEAELLDLKYERPHIILNFSREFEQFGGTSRLFAVLEQLTRTMSSIPGIKSVVLMVEGERVGTEERPFTGDGAIFDDLTIDPANTGMTDFSPTDVLDLFIAAIPEVDKMWALMGPNARDVYGEAARIEYSAFAEGLGNWKNYRVTEENIEGDIAVVIITGDQVLEGEEQPGAVYTAYMVRENGQWKWDFP